MNTNSIETFDRTPRPVPASIAPALYFGGFAGPFGWFFFGFGMIFVWTFTFNSNFSDIWKFSGTVEVTDGAVIGASATNFSVGGSSSSSHSNSGTPVYEITYRFKDLNGNDVEGTCYKTGWNPSPRQGVQVEFVASRPEVSRIVGTRTAIMTWPVGLIPVLFPAIGLCFMVSRWRKGRKAHRLLRNGRLGVGRLVNKERTNTTINDQRVYKFTFEFTTDSGQAVQATVRTHDARAIEDEPEEFLLYDVMDPESAVLFDALPAKVAINDDGYIEGGGMRNWLILVIPGVAIVGNVVGAVMVLG